MVAEHTNDPVSKHFMGEALKAAQQSQADTSSRFRVGAVLVDNKGEILSRGFTAELPGNTHAEECALEKLFEMHRKERALELIKGSDIYTTLQPCTLRLSGLKTCVDRLVEARIGRCYIGAEEPDDFVRSSGYGALEAVNVEIFIVDGMEKDCLAVARGQML